MKVGIIGSGISGLTSVYYLLKNNKNVCVTLYSDKKIGGHSYTYELDSDKIDIGFQVFNYKTYPNFIRMMKELNVSFQKSCMSYSFSNSSFSYGTRGFWGLFSSLFSWTFINILYNMCFFHRDAHSFLNMKDETTTFKEFCVKHRYSKNFVNYYLKPMCAAIWSISPNELDQLPMIFFLQFMENHSFLSFIKEQWYTLENRSQDYVTKILNYDPTRLNVILTKVNNVTYDAEKKKVYIDDSEYDSVIIATECSHIKNLLKDNEYDDFKKLYTSENKVVIHRDKSVMPKNKNLWASWNSFSNGVDENIYVTYWCKNLQKDILNKNGDIFVSLNLDVDNKYLIESIEMKHPKLTLDMLNLKKNLNQYQGKNNIYFAGAWIYNCFHEDGVRSAMDVVEKILDTNLNISDINSKINLQYTPLSSIFFNMLKSIKIKNGQLNIKYRYDEHTFGKSDIVANVTIHNNDFFKDVLLKGALGFSESYMKGHIEIDNLSNFINVMSLNLTNVSKIKNHMSIFYNIYHKLNKNTLVNSKKNIEYHYDLSNDFYKLFLDQSMTYSSGYFKKPSDELYDAQLNKYDRIIDKLGITKEDRVLEIGCGWGGFMERCSERIGCHIDGVTLSIEQYEYIKKNRDTSKFNVHLIDYRNIVVKEKYTKIVSIEMIEAVGHEFLEEYFRCIKNLLVSNGKVLIQAISVPEVRYQNYLKNCDFIQKYIFPGSVCPSLNAIIEASYIRGNNFIVADVKNLSDSYAITLDYWQKRFNDNWFEIEKLDKKFDTRFKNMWNYYLSYCYAGFKNKIVNVNQIIFIQHI